MNISEQIARFEQMKLEFIFCQRKLPFRIQPGTQPEQNVG